MNRTDGTMLSTGQGTYRLGRLLGRGGMAEVFAATALGAAGFERPACIKFVLPAIGSDAEFRTLFLREVRLAGQLCHANLVQVFDCFEHGEQLGLVMELVDGMDLKAVARRLAERHIQMPAGLVAYVAGQMLLGLCVAHQRRIVHRDISPHNVLVSRQGEIKIADFGVAKAMVTQASRTGNLRGKLAYMSPEQARGKAVDFRTDLYSTGLVLWELITAERFVGHGSSQWKLFYDVVHAERPTLTNVEPQLAGFVERLLAPDPDKRYQSAEEALAALPPWEVTGPIGARELASFLDDLTDEEPIVASDEGPALRDTVPTPSTQPAPCSRDLNMSIPATTSIREDEADTLEADAPPENSMPPAAIPRFPRIPVTTAVPALNDVGEYTAVGSRKWERKRRQVTWAAVLAVVLAMVLTAGLSVGVLVRLFIEG